MTLPSSGPISFDDINVELGNPVGTTISLNDQEVRDLVGIPSGNITLPGDFYGKSAIIFNSSITSAELGSSLNVGYNNGVGGSITEDQINLFDTNYTIEQINETNAAPKFFTLRISTPSGDMRSQLAIKSLENLTIEGVELLTDNVDNFSVTSTNASWQWSISDQTLPDLTNGVTSPFSIEKATEANVGLSLLSAGQDSTFIGFRDETGSTFGDLRGRVFGNVGNLSCASVFTFFNAITGYNLQVNFNGVTTQNYFSQITIEGTFAGGSTTPVVLNTASADSFDNPSGKSRWVWDGLASSTLMVNGNDYTVTIT